jgi:hypothetical protein
MGLYLRVGVSRLAIARRLGVGAYAVPKNSELGSGTALGAALTRGVAANDKTVKAAAMVNPRILDRFVGCQE